MSKNIEMNIKIEDGYEVLYPKTKGSNVVLDSGMTVEQKVNNIYPDDVFEVGDILCTTKQNIGEEWIECNGEYINYNQADNLSYLPKQYLKTWETVAEEKVDKTVYFCHGVYFSSLNTIGRYSTDRTNWINLNTMEIYDVIWIDKYNSFFVIGSSGTSTSIYRFSSSLSLQNQVDITSDYVGNNVDSLTGIAIPDYSEQEDCFVTLVRARGLSSSSSHRAICLIKINAENFSLSFFKALSTTTASSYNPERVYTTSASEEFPYIAQIVGSSSCRLFSEDSFTTNLSFQVMGATGDDLYLFKLGGYFFTNCNTYCKIGNNIRNQYSWVSNSNMNMMTTPGASKFNDIISFVDKDNNLILNINTLTGNITSFGSSVSAESQTVTNLNRGYTRALMYNGFNEIHAYDSSGEYISYSQIQLPNIPSASTSAVKEKYYIKKQ